MDVEIDLTSPVVLVVITLIIGIFTLLFVFLCVLGKKRRKKLKRRVFVFYSDDELGKLSKMATEFVEHFRSKKKNLLEMKRSPLKKKNRKILIEKSPISDFAFPKTILNEDVVFVFILQSGECGEIERKLVDFFERSHETKGKSEIEVVKKNGFAAFFVGNEEKDEAKFGKRLQESLTAVDFSCENFGGVVYADKKGDFSRQYRAWKGHAIRNILTPHDPTSKKRKKKKKKVSAQVLKNLHGYDVEDCGNPLIDPRSQLRATLLKQRYALVGSHSAVKLCRWVKNSLRGKGCCYKHSAYGITTYCCIQSTTCIACANKCVFCWRHNQNPVTTKWRDWDAEDPEILCDKFVSTQRSLIKELRGLPNMPLEWFNEAYETPKHCALSLIGEPLLYPHISKFIHLLHLRGISTFLVTNGQFPEELEKMGSVTQLYLSINAPNRKILKRVSRPVFAEDYWDKFIKSCQILGNKKVKRERTVFRLTLMKSQNMCDIEGYAKLIKIARPSFVEVKGVTYCGAESVGMTECPFHSDLREFAMKLFTEGKLEELGYGIAVEHTHTVFVLIAKKEYLVNGEWHTWIDFDKFTKLIKEGKDFNEFDYMKKTPHWAIWGAKEKGTDPNFVLKREEKEK